VIELFPIIQPQQVEFINELPLYREAAWDFKAGKPIFRNGNPVIVTGNEALKTWIWKALVTERARYEIYTWNFGSKVESMIGKNFTEQLKQAEAKRYVREALLVNPYITELSDIVVEFEGSKLTITATVNTIYGEVNVSV